MNFKEQKKSDQLVVESPELACLRGVVPVAGELLCSRLNGCTWKSLIGVRTDVLCDSLRSYDSVPTKGLQPLRSWPVGISAMEFCCFVLIKDSFARI